jgi:hypothetical protein
LEEIARDQAERRKRRKPPQLRATFGCQPTPEHPISTGVGWSPLWAFVENVGSDGGMHTETRLPMRADLVPTPKAVKPMLIRTLPRADFRALSRGKTSAA